MPPREAGVIRIGPCAQALDVFTVALMRCRMEELTPPGHISPRRWMMPSPFGGFHDYHDAA